MLSVHSVCLGDDYTMSFLFEGESRVFAEIREHHLQDTRGIDDGSTQQGTVTAFATQGGYYREQFHGPEELQEDPPLFQLTVHGIDRAGAIAEVTSRIEVGGEERASILGMSGVSYDVASADPKRFLVRLKLGIPSEAEEERLRQALSELTEREYWRMSLEPLTSLAQR